MFQKIARCFLAIFLIQIFSLSMPSFSLNKVTVLVLKLDLKGKSGHSFQQKFTNDLISRFERNELFRTSIRSDFINSGMPLAGIISFYSCRSIKCVTEAISSIGVDIFVISQLSETETGYKLALNITSVKNGDRLLHEEVECSNCSEIELDHLGVSLINKLFNRPLSSWSDAITASEEAGLLINEALRNVEFKDYDNAIKLANRACELIEDKDCLEKRDIISKIIISLKHYANFEGTKGNYKKALELYQRACELQDSDSCNLTEVFLHIRHLKEKGNHKLSKKKFSDARKIFEEACGLGDEESCARNDEIAKLERKYNAQRREYQRIALLILKGRRAPKIVFKKQKTERANNLCWQKCQKINSLMVGHRAKYISDKFHQCEKRYPPGKTRNSCLERVEKTWESGIELILIPQLSSGLSECCQIE
jgi:tetratricopeptide (TPR) repeat protein